MVNLNLIFPEIFISLSTMFLLILGAFKKNSSKIIHNLSIISLLLIVILIFNNQFESNIFLFSNSYVIDYLSSFYQPYFLILNHNQLS